MVSETIRWPRRLLAHMRRTATRDVEFGRQDLIKAGDKVVMWYVSGNRDEAAIENPNAYIVDRARPRQHVSFGFGIHPLRRQPRLAELQLQGHLGRRSRQARSTTIKVMGEPTRVGSSFIKGYEYLPVRLTAKA